MAVIATEWNVLIVGAWNLAILTPDGICKLLFGLPEGAPVDIEVALDKPGYYRVRHEGVSVTPSVRVLDIAAGEATPSGLSRACDVAVKAISSLPATPLMAAGVNFRYSSDELPAELLSLIEMDLDNEFSDGGYEIASRHLRRTLKLDPGVVNVDLALGATTAGTVLFNFHVDSTDINVLIEWLGRVQEFCATSEKLLGVLKLDG